MLKIILVVEKARASAAALMLLKRCCMILNCVSCDYASLMRVVVSNKWKLERLVI